MSYNSCLNLPGAVDQVGELAGASLRLLLVIHASGLDVRNALLHLHLTTLRYRLNQCFGSGSGSGSVLDPYSIGPLDPDP
jgi:hypothetical protein